jgi:hypothetical protein
LPFFCFGCEQPVFNAPSITVLRSITKVGLSSSQGGAGLLTNWIPPHDGVGLYRPIRVKVRRFGACFTIVPADFQGKNITLKAFLKTENIPDDGMAGLWMRIDGEGRMLEFDNMQNRPVKGTTGWTEYTISLPLPEASEKIFIGGLMTGTGKMWVDDFRLFVDDKPLTGPKDKNNNHVRRATRYCIRQRQRHHHRPPRAKPHIRSGTFGKSVGVSQILSPENRIRCIELGQ